MEITNLKKKLKEYMAIPRVSGYEKEMAYALKQDLLEYNIEDRSNMAVKKYKVNTGGSSGYTLSFYHLLQIHDRIILICT